MHRFVQATMLNLHEQPHESPNNVIGKLDLNMHVEQLDDPTAAAISFVVRKASKFFPTCAAFRFSASHGRHVHDGNVAPAENRPAPFWGSRSGERSDCGYRPSERPCRRGVHSHRNPNPEFRLTTAAADHPFG